MDSRRDKFIVATNQLVDTLKKTIENAKKIFSSRAAGEGPSQPGPMFKNAAPSLGEPTWTAYWEWMKVIGVSSKQEVEELKASFDKDDKELSKCIEELNAVEEQFGKLASMLNAIIQKKEDKVSELPLI